MWATTSFYNFTGQSYEISHVVSATTFTIMPLSTMPPSITFFYYSFAYFFALILGIVFSECGNDDWHYDDWHHAECWIAECHFCLVPLC